MPEKPESLPKEKAKKESVRDEMSTKEIMGYKNGKLQKLKVKMTPREKNNKLEMMDD